ncbi:MAG: winged helix-turn-helix domain-containing protein [Burkholderiales bacterium]
MNDTPASGTTAYRFAGFELLPGERMLTLEGAAVAVGPRAFDVLVVLVERMGALVSKDELLARVWPKLVVEDNNLAVQVSALRKIVGHDAIATVAGQGYRFCAPVSAACEPLPRQTRPPSLPRAPTSFLGRSAEVSECANLLDQTRLLTLVGVGGIGKTRLAIEVAALVSGQFADGVTFVDLAPLEDPRSTIGAIASALGVSDVTMPLIDAVQSRLAGRTHLLVLDNCEHLLSACAAIAAQILRTCAGPGVLATSREPLHVAGERVFQVPTLEVPHCDASPAALRDSPAAALFVDRATAVDSGFEVTPGNVADIAAICRSLEGIPLALELAASRVRAMPLKVISGHLHEQFRLLAGGDRALPRQHTLRATLDWSYRLLAEPERSLFRRLSVFAGGFELDAAEVVGIGNDVGAKDVVYLLADLVDKSLIAFEPRANRYRMLEPVRQYALERLVEAGEENDARDAHLRFHVDWAAAAGTEIRTPRQVRIMARAVAERDNIAVAFARARDKADGGSAGLAMIFPLVLVLSNAGHMDLCRRLLHDALAHPGAQEDSVARCRALGATAWNEYVMGRYDEAYAMATRCVAMARRCADDVLFLDALYLLGVASMSLGRGVEARQSYVELLDLATRAGNPKLASDAHGGLGEIDSLEGHLEAAQGHYLETLRLNPDDLSSTVSTLFNLSRNEALLGREEPALRYLRRAAGSPGAVDGAGRTAFTQGCLCHCAWAAARRGDWPRAVRFFGAAAAHRERIGYRYAEPEASIIERTLQLAREAAGTAADEGFAAGRTLHEDAARDEALAWLATLPETPGDG